VALEDQEHMLGNIKHILDKISLYPATIESFPSMLKTMGKIQPDECYHLAAQSFVSYSFEDDATTLTTNINGTHSVLAAVHQTVPQCRFYFAASSEMFGRAEEVPQNEKTRFHPRSVYGISKIAGFDLTRNYREAYNMHASCGILYNHESPRRGYEFVTRKITSHVAKIKLGMAKKFSLGNLEAKRDWGDAREYVNAIWLMLQQPEPDDYVIATGVVHSVREFLELAFSYVDMDYRKYVEIDQRFLRPSDEVLLIGDASKAKNKLKWVYNSSFEKLVKDMVDTDLKRLQGHTTS